MTDDPEAIERRVLDAVERRRERVNDAIEADLPVAEPARLYEAARYLLDAGGKRLRATVLLLAAEAVADVEPDSRDYRGFPAAEGGPVDVMAAAVSIELIQSFTLIHDDIMDDDDLRRGVPTVHQRYDTETAILAGDTLYSKAFETMGKADAAPENGLEAMNLLARTCTHICEGQALDVQFERAPDVLPEEYLEMVEHKTAVLYGASAATPAVLLGADESVVDALYQYGIDAGSAFQIQDDVLDLTAPSDALGKDRGSDLVEGKRRLITLHARQQGVDVDALLPEDPDEADIEEAIERLREVGSIAHARDAAEDLVADSKSHLSALPDNRAHDLLADVADYLITRGY